MNDQQKCDWTSYYSDHKYRAPEFIIKKLWKNYRGLLKKHAYQEIYNKNDLVIAELGGADSHFYELFLDELNISSYNVIDNNEFGLQMSKNTNSSVLCLHNFDLLKDDPSKLNVCADLVFSAGLIEHFTPENTRTIIESHFSLLKSGGIAFVSFPTPTLVYKAFRCFLEKVDRFPPLYERPLHPDEVIETVQKYGVVLDNIRIYSTLLTQQVILVKKL